MEQADSKKMGGLSGTRGSRLPRWGNFHFILIIISKMADSSLGKLHDLPPEAFAVSEARIRTFLQKFYCRSPHHEWLRQKAASEFRGFQTTSSERSLHRTGRRKGKVHIPDPAQLFQEWRSSLKTDQAGRIIVFPSGEVEVRPGPDQ